MACEDVILLAVFPSHLWPHHLEASHKEPVERSAWLLLVAWYCYRCIPGVFPHVAAHGHMLEFQ